MTDAPKIEFPCRYPIKVIGELDSDYSRQVLEVVRVHAQDVSPDDVSLRESKTGRFASVRINILARSEAQLQALHKDLMALDKVRMVL